MNLLNIFTPDALVPDGTSAGVYQTALFFDCGNWTTGNVVVYITCLLLALLVININKVWTVLKCRTWHWPANGWVLGFIILSAILLSIINPSLPYDEAHAGQADPFFAFVSILCIVAAAKTLLLVLLHAKDCFGRDKARFELSVSRRNVLLWAAMTGWALAFLCYFVGMYAGGTQKSLLAVLLRPALMASKMFVLLDALGEIAAPFKQNGLFMGFYAFVKLYVLAITSTTFIGLVWLRLAGYLGVHFTSSRGKRLFVFFGLDESCQLLAKDIARNVPEDQRILLFVDRREANKEPASFLSVTGFVSLFSHKREAFETAHDQNALLLISYTPLENSEVTGKSIENLGLKELKRLSAEADEVMMFFLSADEEANTRGASNMRTILGREMPQKQFHLFVAAEDGPQMWSLGTTDGSGNVETTGLDTRLMSVQTLLKDVESQPVNFVEIDTSTASVSSNFESMVIGFGRMGQEMVKVLYEFGAFLDNRCQATDCGATFRSPFHCTVVDPQMGRLQKHFAEKYPAMTEACNFAQQANQSSYAPNSADPLLAFHTATPCDNSLITLLEEKLPHMNYIVLALEDDHQNMAVLTCLMNMLMRIRGRNLHRLHIFIKDGERKESATLHRMAAYYNQVCTGGQPIVTVFGGLESLMTYDLVVGEHMQKSARQFYEEYCAATNQDDAMTWDVRHRLGYGLIKSGNATLWEQHRKVRRQELQEMHNHLHIYTKKRLVTSQGNMAVPTNEMSQGWTETKQFLNLSRTEHLRWVASHEAMGYSAPSGSHQIWCDEMTMTHHCLTTWEALPQLSAQFNQQHPGSQVDYQDLDSVVVKVSLGLSNP